MTVEEHQPGRILVLGSRPSTRVVDSFLWDELPAELNIADYDQVVFDLVPLIANDSTAKRVDWNSLPTADQVMRLLKSRDGVLIVVGGRPDLALYEEPEMETRRGRSQQLLYDVSALYTLSCLFPLLPHFNIGERGERIVEVDDNVGWYMDQVGYWTWWADRDNFDPHHECINKYLRESGPTAKYLHPHMSSLAQTRFGKSVAFSLEYLAMTEPISEIQRHGFDFPTNVLTHFGPIIWLPQATKVASIEAVDLILHRMLGVSGIKQAPEWSDRYRLPDEEAAAVYLESLRVEARELAERIEIAEKRLREEQRFKKLLYEQGDELEEAVWEALEVLGATVHRPAANTNEEDGRLEDSLGKKAMLEIKGRGGSIKLQDVRQLHDWMENALHNEGWEGKGILVANAHLAQDPEQRQQPFPDNCVKAAERYGICLLTSKKLFDEVKATQEGRANPEQFWDFVSRATGTLSSDM